MEYRLLPCGDGLACHTVLSGKFRRYHGDSLWQHMRDVPTLMRNVRDGFKVIIGFFQSLILFVRIRPDVVFSKGGYTALPVGLAAACCRIRLVTHDSDVVPGLTNRILRRFATEVACGFPREGSTFTGNPVNPALHTPQPIIRETNKPVILFMGGSQGARIINRFVFEHLDRLYAQYTVLHITGQGDFVNAPRSHPDYQVYDFVEPAVMGRLLQSADVVVSRAGANAIAELAAAQVATVLIPGQHMTGGQQLANASAVADQNAAYVLYEHDLNEEAFLRAVEHVLARKQQYAAAIHALYRPDAARKLAELITQEGRA